MKDVVKYEANDTVALRSHIILKNSQSLLGTALNGGQYNIAQVSEWEWLGHDIVDIGSTSAHLTFNSIDRPNVQLQGESGNHLHQMAYLADVEEVSEDLAHIKLNMKHLK